MTASQGANHVHLTMSSSAGRMPAKHLPRHSRRLSGLRLTWFARRHWAGRRDLVAHVPQVFVEPMLHALLEDFDWRAHGSNHPTANDALRQFQMVKAEDLHPFIEIDQPLGNIMEAETFFVAAVKIVGAQAGVLELPIKCIPETRPTCRSARNPGESSPLPCPSPARMR